MVPDLKDHQIQIRILEEQEEVKDVDFSKNKTNNLTLTLIQDKSISTKTI